jgi:deoxyribose-phosphate aldolase
VIKLASYIDHTILKPTCTHIEIEKICKEALEYGFAAVCVPPPHVFLAGRAVRGALGAEKVARSGVKVATVIGFPFGYSAVKAKLAEVEQAIADAAEELDIVINLIALKEGRWPLLEEEMRVLTGSAHSADKIVKVIIESGVLSDEEVIRCCDLYARVGVDYLKTSTGYAEKGATIGAVRLMRRHLPAGIRIKASGGIRDAVFARELIAAGAERLGCSAGVQIVREDEMNAGGSFGEPREMSGKADFY